jgi:hypothetical protein
MVKIYTNFRAATAEGPPAALAAIKAALEFEQRDFDADAFGCVMATRSFYEIDHRGRLLFMPGLANRAHQTALRAGFEVGLEDRRILPTDLAIDPLAAGALTGEQERIVQAIGGCPRGQIEVTSQKQCLERLQLLCQVFPGQNVLVFVPTLRFGRKVFQWLRRELGSQVQFARGSWTSSARIVVCTYCHITHPAEWQMILLPDPMSAVSDSALQNVADAAGWRDWSRDDGLPTRVYAFPKAGYRPTRREQLGLEALAGPLLVASRTDVVTANACMCAYPTTLRRDKLDGLAYKRDRYWLNPERSRHIAAVANAITDAVVQRSVSMLWKLGVMVDDVAINNLPNHFRAVILVESTEHARALHSRLPGWERRDLADNNAGRRGARMIVTVSYMLAYGIEADILIRAEGGGRMEFAGFPRPGTAGAGQTAILVDFDDHSDAAAAAATRQRVQDYTRRGWMTELTQISRSRLHTRLQAKHTMPTAPFTPSHTAENLHTRVGTTPPDFRGTCLGATESGKRTNSDPLDQNGATPLTTRSADNVSILTAQGMATPITKRKEAT